MIETTKLTPVDRNNIIKLIDDKAKQLGSYNSVATFCKVSSASISQMRGNIYSARGEDMWLNVAAKLGYKPGSTGKNWQFVETTDFKSISKLLTDAKNNSLFIPISDQAGTGKTGALKHFAEMHANNGVFYLRCWDWGKREFLENLCRTLGIDIAKGFKTPNSLIMAISSFFQNKSLVQPLLIIDEFDKLRPTAKMCMIPLYNECEDGLSVVASGTENLEKEITRGVRYQTKGYDEIESRFGRKYIKLIGCNIKEVTMICEANGVHDAERIKEMFEDCKPIRKELAIGDKKVVVRVITDLRRLKRLIQKEVIRYSNN